MSSWNFLIAGNGHGAFQKALMNLPYWVGGQAERHRSNEGKPLKYSVNRVWARKRIMQDV